MGPLNHLVQEDLEELGSTGHLHSEGKDWRSPMSLHARMFCSPTKTLQKTCCRFGVGERIAQGQNCWENRYSQYQI